ncbi:uncharacterized protein [Periplaneta americana]|uniref:uncharacterized protein n=1 Tax=Periplaneta americana TaxID=6978 RepID=UPI0037E80709
MRRNAQVLLGLYCITLLHYIVPSSAISITASSDNAAVNLQRQTINTKQPAERADHSYTKTGLTDILSSKVSSSKGGIKKRSAEALEFPEDFPIAIQENNMDTIVDECKYTGLCNKQFYDNDESQQTLNSQMSDNQEYSNFKYSEDGSFSNPYTRYLAKEIKPDREGIQTGSNIYYTLPSQEDMNKDSDANSEAVNNIHNFQYNSEIPGVVVLALRKPEVTEWMDRQALTDRAENKNGFQPVRKVKKNIFTSRGWGAGGMPFSVLYMHQQQHMKPASRSPIAGAQQLVAPAPLRDYPTASQYRQVAVRNALSSALTAGNNGGGGASAPLPTRRQYSIIPQLYVSYGWGPHGK